MSLNPVAALCALHTWCSAHVHAACGLCFAEAFLHCKHDGVACCGWLLLAVLQRLTQQLSQVEHQQSLAASEAALAPLNPFQRSQVWMPCSAQSLAARAGSIPCVRQSDSEAGGCCCLCGVLQVKDCVGEQVQQLAPSLVNYGIATHVQSMIDEVSLTWAASRLQGVIAQPAECACCGLAQHKVKCPQ